MTTHRTIWRRLGLVIGCTVIGAATLLPLVLVLKIALQPNELGLLGAFGVHPLTFSNFLALADGSPVVGYLLNSITVATVSTALSLAAAAPAAYSFTRFQFRGRRVFSTGILLLYMVPPIVLAVPLLTLFSRLGLFNTLGGLIMANTAIGVPFAAWLLMGFFSGIPGELVDSALVDGCTHVSSIRRIVLPLALPGLVAAGVTIFIFAWNDFIFAFTLTSGEQAKTIQIVMRSFITGEAGVFWGTIMATVTVASLPVVILFMFSQRGLIGGLAEGGVKG